MIPDHPPLFLLDGLAAGDDDPTTSAHLEACETCRAYVEKWRVEAQSFAKNEDVNGFVAKLERPRPRSIGRIVAIGAPLVAAAAALVLLLRTPEPQVPPRESVVEPRIRFKGKIQLSVVRDRSGAQERFTTEVPVKPDDRVRVEVGLDREAPITVLFIGNDGSTVVLLAPTLLDAGLHLSERSARFDATPTEGAIVAGPPEAVERAKATRTFDEVTTIPIVLER